MPSSGPTQSRTRKCVPAQLDHSELSSRRTIYMFWLRSSTYDIVMQIPLCLLRCVSKELVFPTEEMLDIDVDNVF